mgnify:CR=1 FL=1
MQFNQLIYDWIECVRCQWWLQETCSFIDECIPFGKAITKDVGSLTFSMCSINTFVSFSVSFCTVLRRVHNISKIILIIEKS